MSIIKKGRAEPMPNEEYLNEPLRKIAKTLFLFRKHFLSKERTCAKKEHYSFGKFFFNRVPKATIFKSLHLYVI